MTDQPVIEAHNDLQGIHQMPMQAHRTSAHVVHAAEDPSLWTGPSLDVVANRLDELADRVNTIETDTDVVRQSDLAANQIYTKTNAGTFTALTVPADTLVGKVATNIAALNAATIRTLLNVENGADVTDATNVNAAGATMNSDSDVSGTSWFNDEDDLSSDSAVKAPSQQSVKAYADAGESTTAVSTTVSGTSSETDFSTTLTLDADIMDATTTWLALHAGGKVSSDFSGTTYRFRVYIGSTMVFDTNISSSFASLTSKHWCLNLRVRCSVTGSSGFAATYTVGSYINTQDVRKIGTNAFTIDWTSSNTVKVSVQMGTSAAGNQSNMDNMAFHRLRAAA